MLKDLKADAIVNVCRTTSSNSSSSLSASSLKYAADELHRSADKTAEIKAVTSLLEDTNAAGDVVNI
jgi:hypothetical protein